MVSPIWNHKVILIRNNSTREIVDFKQNQIKAVSFRNDCLRNGIYAELKSKIID